MYVTEYFFFFALTLTLTLVPLSLRYGAHNPPKWKLFQNNEVDSTSTRGSVPSERLREAYLIGLNEIALVHTVHCAHI